MSDVWLPHVSLIDKVLRAVIVYGFLLAALRVTGKRQVGQLTPFDLVVLLIIANAVQNAMIGPDTSVVGGLLSAVIILAVNYVVVGVAFRWRSARHVLEAEPTLLVHNGRILSARLARERLTLEDLHAALRRHGVADVTHVRIAMLEDDGVISVIRG